MQALVLLFICSVAGELPTVFLLGCPKCASTSLWSALVQQPELCPATPVPPYMAMSAKELHFFSNLAGRFRLGVSWYKGNFNRSRLLLDGHVNADGCQFVDGSPSYLDKAQFPSTAQRMHATYPPLLRQRLRLIAILREPLSLLVSFFNYFHETYTPLRGRTFPQWVGMWGQVGALIAGNPVVPAHLSIADWMEQLQPFWFHFSPSNVFVVDQRLVITEFHSIMRGLADFIGVKFSLPPHAKLPSENRGGENQSLRWWHISSLGHLPNALCMRLVSAFAGRNLALLVKLRDQRQRGLAAVGQPEFDGFASVACNESLVESGTRSKGR